MLVSYACVTAGEERPLSICYHPHAFDAQRFAEAMKSSSSIDVVALTECELEQPSFGWSIDGTSDGDIISRREPSGGSLVENVRAALAWMDEALDRTPDHAEAEELLAHVSEHGGRLVDYEMYVGYLMPDEISRVSALLATMTFANPWVERDRQVLL